MFGARVLVAHVLGFAGGMGQYPFAFNAQGKVCCSRDLLPRCIEAFYQFTNGICRGCKKPVCQEPVFAHKAQAVETITMAFENGGWVVTDYSVN